MSTAWQSNAFQSDAFQERGGVSATTFEASFALLQESDSVSLQINLPSSGAGRSRRRHRYIAKYKGQEHEFDSLEELEDFVAVAKQEQSVRPKRTRAAVKIFLSPDFVEEIQPVIEYPRRIESMPTTAAMAQVRRIDNTLAKLLADAQKAADEEDEELCLMCLI